MRLPPKLTVNAPKPDLVQLVSQLPAGAVAGCKWCKKTLFWNGSFWNHVDGDRHECQRFYPHNHDLEVVGHEEVQIGKTWFRERPIMGQAPVHSCTACGKQKVAKLWEGRWLHDLGYKCLAKVATPQDPAQPPGNTPGEALA